MTATLSKKDAKKAEAVADAEQVRLITRIRNLFELEQWSTEAIAEAVGISRSEVIRLIQSSRLDKQTHPPTGQAIDGHSIHPPTG